MTLRRGQTDPFLASRQTQWLLVSVVGGAAVSVAALDPGTDLRRVFLDCVDSHRSQGWVIEHEPTYPCVFAHKDEVRRMVTICQVDPAGSPLGHFSPWRS
jgi:hypothetical protein